CAHPSKSGNDEYGPAWKSRRARPEAHICRTLLLGKGTTLSVETKHDICTLRTSLSMQGVFQQPARYISALIVLLLSCVTHADCDFSDFPTMVEMKVSTLMGNATYNSRPMDVRSFSASASEDQLVRFYQNRWRDEFAESKFEAWKQIAHLEDDCLYTVQYGSVGDNNTFGRLLMSEAPTGDDMNVALGEGVVKPGDAMVVSDLLTNDKPKKGRVTVITSEQSVAELASFYQTEMRGDNWSLEHSFSRDGGTVLVFRKGLSENNVIIMPAGDATQILVNEVKVN
ncbi:hypothetical protein SCD92_10235, partial [Gilvimarinus sp. SDUM040013]